MDTKQFCKAHNITISSNMVGENPNMFSDPNWKAYHYKVTLKRDERIEGKRTRRQMTTYFSMGIGLTDDPNAADVLDCIASDSSSVENAQNFENWADDLGYDTGSRKAEKTYKLCQHQAERLEKFLETDLYNELLWHTGRL